MALLEVQDVTVRFGGHTALSEVGLEVEPGEVTGLIGPNGAGKTTLFNIITGLLPATGGSVVLGGKNIGGLAPYRRARLGVARTFQRLELFGQLTVRENTLVAASLRRRWGSANGESDGQVADRLLDRLGLTSLAHVRADTLPTGQGRLVELARALAIKPRLLLLDEPASGQDEQETQTFAALLLELAADGLGILLVEHDMALVMGVCTKVVALDFGQVLAVGTPDEVRTNPRVQEAYLGTDGSSA
jgi:branched-chain amino acid transport system ATP-binding protein